MSEKIIIENTRNKPIRLKLKQVWEYRALIKAFAIRDIKTQYVQTKLGILWSFIQAFTAAIIVNFFFGYLMKIDTGDIPYIIFAFPGLIAWYYFTYMIFHSGTSLLQSQNLIKKIYFPKLVLPFYKSFVGLFELFSWSIIFIGLCMFYQFSVSINTIFIPIAVLLNMIVGLSIALWLSAITVRYRDALMIIPFLVGFGIFVTPVFFTSTMIPEAYSFFIYLNPMAGVIAFYRWCLFNSDFTFYYLLGFIPTLIFFIGGLFYFRRVEALMVDLV
ncbi:MAG: ABC transporter permease [Methanolobus sp.]|nr:ABC transporter permease [Methanolobus sp.]